MTDLLKVLIIDDNPDDRFLIRHELEKHFVITIYEVKDKEDLDHFLDEIYFDIVITDYKLNWSNGTDVLLKIKSVSPSCPVIMFTGTGNEEIAVEAMKFGLDDYIIKSPNRYHRITISINRIIKAIEERQEKESIRNSLEKEKEKQQQFMDNAIIGYYRMSVKGEILYANKTLLQMLGYNTIDEMMKCNMLENGLYQNIHNSDFMDEMDIKGEVFGYESIWLKKDGSRLYIRENSKSIIDDKGQLLYYEGSVENISDLKESKLLIKSILDIAKTSIEKTSIKEFYSFVMKEIRKLLLVDIIVITRIDEKSGKLFLDYTNEYEDLLEREILSSNSIYNYMLDIEESILIDEIEAEELSQKGVLFRQIFYQWMGVRIKNGNETTGILAVINKSQPDLYTQEHLRLLEFISSQIGLLIEKKHKTHQLIKAHESVRNSDDLIASFLANLSHELRTPLNGILGFSELLNECDTASKEIKRFSSLINSNSRRLHLILDNLIELSQLEASTVKLEYEQIILDPFLYEIFTSFITSHKKAELSYEYLNNPEQRNIIIEADKHRIKRCVVELLNNAYKHTEKGTIELGFFISDNFINISVTDTGSGINKEYQKTIFNKFVTIGNHLMGENNGTGVGLTLCEKIVKLHRGDIWITSEQTKGTTVNFRIPYNINSDNWKKYEYPDWSKRTFLIYEEQERDYQLLELFLYKTGCRLLWAKDTDNALKIFLKDSEIDLVILNTPSVLTDYFFSIIEDISQIDINIPVIVITPYPKEHYIDKVIKTSNICFLDKPLQKAGLLLTLAEMLKK